MIVLCIDSAGAGCAACVWQDGKVISISSEKMERGQDARLVPLVLEVMKAANVSFDVTDKIAVTRGPGSFTGLRVGISAARGLGLASNKPVIGIDRFSIYEKQYPARAILTALDSRRLELFCKLSNSDDAQLLTPTEIAALLKKRPDLKIAGDAENILKPVIQDSSLFLPKIEEEVVTGASIAAAISHNDSDFLPRPLYLRQPDVTIAKESPGFCASGAP